MFLQSIFISVISVSYYHLLVEIMSSTTPVLAIKAIEALAIDALVIDAPVIDAPVIDAPVIDAPVIDAPANTNTTKKVKKVRVPAIVPAVVPAIVPAVQALEAEAAVESGSTATDAAAPVAPVADADAKKVKKVRVPVQALEAAAAPEKKKRAAVKKPQEKEAAAVTEVVQMVADMKTAFTEATEATEATDDKEVEVAATVVVEDAETELVLDEYIESSPLGDFEPLDFEPLVEVEFGDSIVDFEELRLDGDETPCCNPIPEPIQEEEAPLAVAVAAVAAAAVVRPVFRFEFSSECFDLLNGFARENLGVPRKEYKAKWEQFATAHAEFIAQESARLADAGYGGDVLVKMFKTVKYYLTKRVKKAVAKAVVDDHVMDEAALDDDDATVDAEDAPHEKTQTQTQTQTRRHYTTLDRAVLEAMDSHITSSISSNSKPATCYASFCDQFRNSIETEIARLVRFDGADADADVVRVDAFTFTEKTAEEKLKKTYKNRMFLHLRNM